MQTGKGKNKEPNSLTLVVLILFYRRWFSKAWNIVESPQLCYCVCFKGWLRVYYGLDLLLSKLSKAQRNEKFGSATTSNVTNLYYVKISLMWHLRFETVTLSVKLLLRTVTLSNSNVKRRLCSAMLRFVTVNFHTTVSLLYFQDIIN